jgi:hypothetical protein
MGTEIDNDVAVTLAQAMLDGCPATVDGRPVVGLELITAALDIIAVQAAGAFDGTPEEAWTDLFQNLRLKARFVQVMAIQRRLRKVFPLVKGVH